ncbi:hypothetical protein BBJ28_00012540 [Nothophytophthora sp. Chile5]|nr:hypothetical protein BBJ28_00012540 [Nothophytophthora sp. Chile5]
MVGTGGRTEKGVPRYPPWLQKALKTKDETERFWLRQQQQQQQQQARVQSQQRPVSKSRASAQTTTIQAISKEEDEGSKTPVTPVSVWDSIAVDDVLAVKMFLEKDKHRFLLRRDFLFCDPSKGIQGGGGGESLLHEASYLGSLRVVRYLLSFMETHFTAETCREVLNAVDAQYSLTTLVIATCRNSAGTTADRAEILLLLVTAGADTARRDSHGDTALHWCARTSQVVLLRYLLKDTDAGAVALSIANYKRQTVSTIPLRRLELLRRLNRKRCLSTLTAHDLLAGVDRRGNLRLKMQALKRYEALAQVRDTAQEKEQLAAALDTAELLVPKAEKLWRDTLELAEKRRKAAEQEHADVAAQVAVGATRQWLESKDGKLFVKKQLPLAIADVKQAVLSGRMPKPKDVKKAAIQRVQELYCREKEQSARKEATESFVATRPPYPRERAAELRRVLHL